MFFVFPLVTLSSFLTNVLGGELCVDENFVLTNYNQSGTDHIITNLTLENRRECMIWCHEVNCVTFTFTFNGQCVLHSQLPATLTFVNEEYSEVYYRFGAVPLTTTSAASTTTTLAATTTSSTITTTTSSTTTTPTTTTPTTTTTTTTTITTTTTTITTTDIPLVEVTTTTTASTSTTTDIPLVEVTTTTTASTSTTTDIPLVEDTTTTTASTSTTTDIPLVEDTTTSPTTTESFEVIEQFASVVFEYSGNSITVDEILGPPDVTVYGPSPSAWSQKTPLKVFDYIIVLFEQEVVMREIHIYENFNTGCISMVGVRTPSGNSYEYPFNQDTVSPLPPALRTLVIPVNYSYASRELYIEVSPKDVGGPVEIDAILVVGEML